MKKNFYLLALAILCLSAKSPNELTFLYSKEAKSPPDKCNGNGCQFVTISSVIRSGSTMVKQFVVKNNSSKTIRFKLKWADFLGQCNTEHAVNIPAGQSEDLNAPSDYNPGYCSISATLL